MGVVNRVGEKKRWGEERCCWGSCLKDESWVVKVSGSLKENLEGAYGKVDEC